jgi:hypothetical protein
MRRPPGDQWGRGQRNNALSRDRSTPLVFEASFELRVRLLYQQLALAGEL